MSADRRGALPDGVRALFAGINYAHVATLMPDGSPHTVPVWVDVDDDTIVLLTGPESRKARNLDRDGRIAISIVDHDQPFTMATVRGEVARRLTGDEAWTVVDRISQKYIGAPYPRGEERVVYVIEPLHAWAQDFR